MALAKEKIFCTEKKLLGDQNEEARVSSIPYLYSGFSFIFAASLEAQPIPGL